MAMILGVFDLLAYAIPGSLYLAVFAYVAHRAGWIDVPRRAAGSPRCSC